MSTCEKCHGTHKIECPECHGEKKVTCEKCHGKGTFKNCNRCGSSGKVTCSVCDGTGEATEDCPVCSYGKVWKSRWINCARCHGTGINGHSPSGRPYNCGRCGGRGQVEEKYQEICPNCHGEYKRKTGKPCKHCGGSGEETCSRCHGTGHARCQECDGTGKAKCDKCDGEGSIKCPDCEAREKQAAEKKRRIEEKQRREVEAREAAEKAAKERKETMQGCGFLIALVAIVGFFVWWWWEGFTMSALSSMWAQTKNSLGCSDSALKTCAMIGGGLVALLVLFKLIKGGKSTGQASDKKRWKFVVLGLLVGCLGIHLAYAKRWGLFALLWAALIFAGMMSKDKPAEPNSSSDPTVEVVAVQNDDSKSNPMKKHNMYENIGMGVWALLWLGGALFIKKDGKGNRM